MRVLLVIAFAACGSLGLGADARLSADEADLVEFAKVKDAQKFGWAALPGAMLTTATPGKIGDHALRMDPSPEPREYMGIGLRHDIDLTGAGSEDKVIFFVKQNFGLGICVNLRTAKGNVYRYVKVTREQWSRVELDLGLANWNQGKNSPVDAWTKVSYLHIYSKAFNKAGEYMLMDGFAFFVGGRPVLARTKRGR